MINGSNEVGTRELGTGAFATIADYATLTYVDGSLATRDTRLDNIDTSLGVLNGLIITNAANIATNATDITNLETSVGVLNGLINTNATDIANLETSVGVLNAAIISNDADIAVNAQSITDLSTGKLDAVASTGDGSYSLYGGEADNVAYIKELIAGSGATITQDASTVTIAVTGAAGYVSKFAYAFTPSGTSEVITSGTHGLGTGPFHISVFEDGEGEVYTGVEYATNGNITLSWSSGALTGDCSVFITG